MSNRIEFRARAVGRTSQIIDHAAELINEGKEVFFAGNTSSDYIADQLTSAGVVSLKYREAFLLVDKNGEWNSIGPDKKHTGFIFYKDPRYVLPVYFRGSLSVRDIETFNALCQDVTDVFLHSMYSDERCCEEGSGTQEGLIFLNERGLELLDRMKDRLKKLGEKIFNESEMDEFDATPYSLIEE